MGSFDEAVAEQMRFERTERNMTAADVAKASGISTAAFIRYERGERSIDMKTLHAWCDAVGVPVAVLIARAEDRAGPPG